MNVSNLRGDHFSPGRPGKEQKLIRLVRADVTDDAAVTLAVEEPLRTRLRVHAMRAQPHCLDDLTDGACFDQLSGLDRRSILEPLAVHDRVDATSFSLNATHFSELCERNNARLIRHVVFAVTHHFDPERGTPCGYRRAQDELDRVVFKDFIFTSSEFGLWIALRECRGKFWLVGIEGDELAASPKHSSDLAVDVIVIGSDDGESNP